MLPEPVIHVLEHTNRIRSIIRNLLNFLIFWGRSFFPLLFLKEKIPESSLFPRLLRLRPDIDRIGAKWGGNKIRSQTCSSFIVRCQARAVLSKVTCILWRWKELRCKWQLRLRSAFAKGSAKGRAQIRRWAVWSWRKIHVFGEFWFQPFEERLKLLRQ